MYDKQVSELLKQLQTEKGPALKRVQQLLNKIQGKEYESD